ncbi:MAG: helix-turn-helix domain-containing protein [Gaiellaceae bacterium]
MPRRKSTHVDDPAAVGERLRAARERAGLTQRDLAFPGCSPAYISRIESGDRIPSLQLLRELGRRLGVSEDFLATGANRAAPDDPRLLDAELALRLGDEDDAQRLYEEVLASPWGNEDYGCALAGLGELAFQRGNPRDAISAIERALQVWTARPADRASLAETLGRAKAMIGQYDESVSIFRDCLDAAEERKDTIGQLRFAVLLANALIDRGDFAKAAEVLESKVETSEGARDPLLRARLYWSQSRLYGMQNDHAQAARYARRALEIVELAEDDYYTARAHEMMAHVEIDRANPEEALRLLDRAWPLLERTANPADKAGFRLERARALAAMGRSEEAGAIAMEVSALLADAKPLQAGRSYVLLGDIYAATNQPERAQELYELGIEKLQAHPDRYLVEAYSKLASLLEGRGEPDAALSVLKRAMDVRASGAVD